MPSYLHACPPDTHHPLDSGTHQRAGHTSSAHLPVQQTVWLTQHCTHRTLSHEGFGRASLSRLDSCAHASAGKPPRATWLRCSKSSGWWNDISSCRCGRVDTRAGHARREHLGAAVHGFWVAAGWPSGEDSSWFVIKALYGFIPQWGRVLWGRSVGKQRPAGQPSLRIILPSLFLRISLSPLKPTSSLLSLALLAGGEGAVEQKSLAQPSSVSSGAPTCQSPAPPRTRITTCQYPSMRGADTTPAPAACRLEREAAAAYNPPPKHTHPHTCIRSISPTGGCGKRSNQPRAQLVMSVASSSKQASGRTPARVPAAAADAAKTLTNGKTMLGTNAASAKTGHQCASSDTAEHSREASGRLS
eukprot:358476-Chlamydomonas_euryale.AAC.3